MKQMILLGLAGAIASGTAAWAAAPAPVFLGDGMVFAHTGSGAYTPPLGHKPKLPSIYNNFATNYPKGLYGAFYGAALSGPDTLHGQIWLAAAFTPTVSATVKEVDVAVSYIAGGSKQVKLHLYADASGVPGTELWSRNVVAPTFGTCCAVEAVGDHGAVKVVAGTQYWLGITTGPKSPTTVAAWNVNVLDQVTPGVNAQDRGTGWQPGGAVPNFAFGIYGN
jgi:hypothetical protein